nr:DUF2812 domain-containing protein [Bacillus haynesii]
MSKKRKRKFRFFLAWQDRKEENWVNEMAKQGWMLKSYFLFIYIFEKTNQAIQYIGSTIRQHQTLIRKNIFIYTRMQAGSM